MYICATNISALRFRFSHCLSTWIFSEKKWGPSTKVKVFNLTHNCTLLENKSIDIMWLCACSEVCLERLLFYFFNWWSWRGNDNYLSNFLSLFSLSLSHTHTISLTLRLRSSPSQFRQKCFPHLTRRRKLDDRLLSLTTLAPTHRVDTFSFTLSVSIMQRN